jgi:hypothetical protein
VEGWSGEWRAWTPIFLEHSNWAFQQLPFTPSIPSTLSIRRKNKYYLLEEEEMPNKINAVLDIAEINARGDTYEFLVAVRRCPAVPLAMRVKIATELLPYERPKLGVTLNINGGEDWAAKLDRAIERSNGNSARVIEQAKVIEHSAEELKEGSRNKKPPPRDGEGGPLAEGQGSSK